MAQMNRRFARNEESDTKMSISLSWRAYCSDRSKSWVLIHMARTRAMRARVTRFVSCGCAMIFL